MKQALTSIIVLPICYFLLSGSFISNISNIHATSLSQDKQSLSPSYFASHNSLIITSNQGISKVQNSLPLYDKIYLTQNVTDVQNSILRNNGIQLLYSLEELLDVQRVKSSWVERFQLVSVRNQHVGQETTEQQQGILKDEIDKKESVVEILQGGKQNQQVFNKVTPSNNSIPHLFTHNYPFLQSLINPQFLSSLLSALPNQQKLLFLPRFIFELLSIQCVEYDGKTILNRKYSIDFKNDTELYDWLGKVVRVGNEEKCGVRLDNKLVIGIMRKQEELRKLILGQEVVKDVESESQGGNKEQQQVQKTQQIEEAQISLPSLQQLPLTEQHYQEQSQTQTTQLQQKIEHIHPQQSIQNNQSDKQTQTDINSSQNQSTQELVVPVQEITNPQKIEQIVLVIDDSMEDKVDDRLEIDRQVVVNQNVQQQHRQQQTIIESSVRDQFASQARVASQQNNTEELLSEINEPQQLQHQPTTQIQPPSQSSKTQQTLLDIPPIVSDQQSVSIQTQQQQQPIDKPFQQSSSQQVDQTQFENESIQVQENNQTIEQTQEEDQNQNSQEVKQNVSQQVTAMQEIADQQFVQQQYQNAQQQSAVQIPQQHQEQIEQNNIEHIADTNRQQQIPNSLQVQNPINLIESSTQQQTVKIQSTQQTATPTQQEVSITHPQNIKIQSQNQDNQQKDQMEHKNTPEQVAHHNQQTEALVTNQEQTPSQTQQIVPQVQQEQLIKTLNNIENQHQQNQVETISQVQISSQQLQQATPSQLSHDSTSNQNNPKQQQPIQFPTNPAFQTPLTQQGLSTQQQQQPITPLAPHQPQTPLQFSPLQPPISNNLIPELQNLQETLLQHTFQHQRKYPLPKQPTFDDKNNQQSTDEHQQNRENIQNTQDQMNFDDLAQAMERLLEAGYESQNAKGYIEVTKSDQM